MAGVVCPRAVVKEHGLGNRGGCGASSVSRAAVGMHKKIARCDIDIRRELEHTSSCGFYIHGIVDKEVRYDVPISP